jgi:CDP-paratose 2-epimerase
VFGYKGKQVRDQIHSADVVSAFDKFIETPRQGEVYNIGGGFHNSASILEIIQILRKDHGLDLNYSLSEDNRIGDHICYYSNLEKIKSDLSGWNITRSLEEIVEEVVFNERK